MSLNGTLNCALYRGVVPIYYLNHKPILKLYYYWTKRSCPFRI